MTSIQMPQLGETIIEGTILKWLKQEGETIERDEPLFEISTDKVDTEVPSPVAGVVSKILVPEGADGCGGDRVGRRREGGCGGRSVGAARPREPAGLPPPGGPAVRPAADPWPGASAPSASAAAPMPDRGPRSQILSPLVRSMAAEHRVDLAAVVGHGDRGADHEARRGGRGRRGGAQ